MSADLLESIGIGDDGLDLIANRKIHRGHAIDLDGCRFVWLKPIQK